MRRASLPFVLAGLVLLAGCTSAPTPSTDPSASPSATVTTSPSTDPSPSSGASPSSDPTAPEGQCADADLTVSLAGGDAGAGSINYQIVFTNNGTADCVLAGPPGVSVVGDSNGTQLGQSAEQVNDTAPAVVTIAPGGTATAQLTAVNIDGGGGALGDACPTQQGDGYRVFPPHSYNSYFIDSPGVLACTGSTPWLKISAVR